ncbi:hypothetical protein LTR05_006284 [Lithohypha guttulata]|uniref:Uncharacterized protein n=1 Tax=Lithohypha guttulata TaxID=1690604 RepID=A0AAN7YEV7_9EURO|nr:hypothetical protein LTR05_006284 [Lithohypha guttulata]
MDETSKTSQAVEPIDLTMDEDDVDQPGGDILMLEPEIVVKKEPEVAVKQEPDLFINPDPDTRLYEALAAELLPDRPISSTGGPTHEDVTIIDEDVQTNNEDLLEGYYENSRAERASSPDNEYQEALAAFEQKQREVVTQESLGVFNPADHVELKTLENALAQSKERCDNLREYENQQNGEDTMFFSDEHATDEEDAPTTGTCGDGDSDANESSPMEIGKGGTRKVAAKVKPKKNSSTKGTNRVTKKAQPGRQSRVQPSANLLNLGSLIRNDLVADAQRNQGLPDQIDFGHVKTKKDALTALVASIPKEQQDTRSNSKKQLDNACKAFSRRGQRSIKPVASGDWKLKGMASPLKSFQLLSTAWAVRWERGSDAPFGGILADTMGYGKTVQMIAVMVENEPKCKRETTLIVVPASLVPQWYEEIAKHTEDGIMEDVHFYRASHCVHIRDIPKHLAKFQVVIATYNEAKDQWWERHYEENRGPLLRMRFYRVILDEAHTIKNHESRTSIACRRLSAKRKWVITGTPLSNRMEELYSYFNFLGVSGSTSFAQFKHNYAKRNDCTMQRLDAILRKVMTRRTLGDRLFGRPLTKLPRLDYETRSIPFNEVEHGIYTIVRQRFINRINSWTASGKIGQSKHHMFVMLLRLRQMCAHVLMITNTFKDLLETEDLEKMWKLVERHSQDPSSSPGTKTAMVVKRILREAQDDEQEANDSPMSSNSGGSQCDTVYLSINDAELDYRGLFYRLQQDGVWDKVRNRSTCSCCHEVPEEDRGKLSVPCSHLYCQQCLDILLSSAADNDTEAECVICHEVMTGAADMTAMELIAAKVNHRGSWGTSEPPAGVAPGKPPRKGKEDPDSKWLSIPNCETLSTKVQAITGQIKSWIEKDADAKIVVFTLFIPIVKLLSRVCVKESWGYQQFTGRILPDQRTKNLRDWKDATKGHQILLTSMRAGGEGLNLTEASYVIIADPWWNEPAEDQAFSRVYRIGQKRDCVVRRFLITDAIDTQLMLHLQKTKARECDRVLDGRSQNEMSVEELLKIFGPTKRNPETGELIVEDGDGVDEFIAGDDHITTHDSDTEERVQAPGRPRSK